jgi:uncharacterized membrane protein
MIARRRTLPAVFVALLAICTLFTFNTIEDLPERVAVHFDTTGVADGWMTRDQYRYYILGFLILLPSLLVWVMAVLPRLTGGRGQIPNSDYWFAQDRRYMTESFLIAHACWLGCLTLAVIYGIHILLLRANAATPSTLPMGRFITMIILYLCGIGWWTARLLRHFQR